MATLEDDDTPSDTGHWSDALPEFQTRFSRVTLAVAAVTALAFLLRFYGLGARIAHWDEARVGWWILDYMQSGNYDYRPIIHGPFYHHVNRFLFSVFGISDFTMRVAVATIGSLVPLSALALRERLRDTEVVGLAIFLAVNPMLLYYSRFMRGDPIVAFFMFVAFVLWVRTVDTAKARYLFAGMACVALAFTAKENALVYLVTWVGATALLLDHRLFRAGDRDQDWVAILKTYVWDGLRRVWQWLPYILLAIVEFVLIIVFFYAPRSSDPDAVAFNNMLSDPSMIPDVIQTATVGSWKDFYGLWVSGGHQDHAYLPFLGDLVQSLGYGALALTVLAFVGFLADRYSEDGPRDVVSFAFYWGFVSILGYPIITDIKAPWAAMHAIIALAIPAAVGLALIFRWGRDAMAREDRVDVGIALILLLVIAGQVAGAGAWAVYLEPQSDENKIVQYAQPGGDIRPALNGMAVAAGGAGAGAGSPAAANATDVLMYSDFFVDGDTEARRTPACIKWFNSLPLPWYFAAQETDVDCAQNASDLSAAADSDTPPPIVIAEKDDQSEVREQFPRYEAVTYEMRTYGTETTFFVHPEFATEEFVAEASGS
jgi:uncharacterized protein (TIGR03663 family)